MTPQVAQVLPDGHKNDAESLGAFSDYPHSPGAVHRPFRHGSTFQMKAIMRFAAAISRVF